jgi:tripartite ATP-independent transporter DctM subunit
MDPTLLVLLVFVLLFGLLAVGMPIGFGMGISAMVGVSFLLDKDAALALLGQTAYETGITYDLSVLPLFVLMGFLASGAGLSEALYKSCNAWLGHRRGGLALATIGGCGAFAAICGSSLATAATMSQVALPEMRRYNYDNRLATGALAAGGTIGILIPPSTLMVLYGLLTETSVSHLFLAGIIPGILLVALYMLAVGIVTYINPKLGPRGERASTRAKLLAIKDIWGTVVLFALVIGGIYAGIFSPSEAAGIGAVGALILSIINRTFTWHLVVNSLVETIKTTAMIFTILIGAILFNNFLILANVPNLIAGWIEGLPLGHFAILVVILLIYLALGCALDSLAMVLLTIPIFFPIITALGFDAVWFGIIVVMVVELGLITPPIGMNVFVIKGIAKDVPLEQIFAGVLPFVIAQVVAIAFVVIFPELALWLPHTM